MGISLIELLDCTIAFYILLCQWTLIFSFSENSSYFILSALTLVVFKLLRVYFMYKNSIRMIYSKDKPLPYRQVFECLLGTEKLKLGEQHDLNAQIIVIVFFILIQDLISWRELFSAKYVLPNLLVFDQPESSTLTCEVPILSYFNILNVIQLLVLLFIKSLTALKVLSMPTEIPMVRIDWFQLISLFVGISSLHGFFAMFSLFLPYISDFLKLLAIKVALIIVETGIICILKLDFFNSDTNNPIQVGLIAGFIQILSNCPINYAPFFSKSWEQPNFKQFQLQTQLSITIVKSGQAIEITYLLFQSYLIDHNIHSSKSQLQYLIIQFFQFSALCSIILFIIEILRKIKEKLTLNYQLYGGSSSSFNELVAVLKNSNHLQYLKINSLTDLHSDFEVDSLKKHELFQALQLHILKYNPSCFIKEIEVMSMSLVYLRNKVFYLKDSNNQFREIFFEELSKISNPEIPLYQLNDQSKYQYQFENIIVRRIYLHGITEEMLRLMEVQSGIFQMVGNQQINQFRSHILEIIVFKRAIEWCLVVNPVQVLHDLWFEESF